MLLMPGVTLFPAVWPLVGHVASSLRRRIVMTLQDQCEDLGEGTCEKT